MGKKKNKNNNTTNAENEVQHKEEPMTKDGGGDGGENEPKKENKNGPSVVVLKVEMDCEGCASKIVKLVRSFEGVESVKADMDSNKLTVIGKVNPSKIRENLHHKTKKKVDLVSPQPKKDDSNDNKTPQNDKKSSDNKKQQPHSDNTTAKKALATTAVLKMNFHCQGCVDRIHKTVSKTKGVDEMSFDRQKETVTVKGTMDAKALAEALKERLKRPVEIVPPKKEKEGGDKEGGSGGGGGGNGGGKNKNGGGGKGSGDGEGGGNKMEMLVQPGFGSAYGFEPVYGYAPVYGNGFMGHPPPPPHQQFQVVYPEYGYGYGYGYVPGYPVHMKFNDENPNACSVM